MRTSWGAVVASAGVIAALALSVPARSAPPDPAPARFLASPRYLLELPTGPTADEIAAATKVLSTAECVAAVLDREFVAAGVVKPAEPPASDVVKTYESKGPERLAAAPRKPGRWSIRYVRTRTDMEAACAPLPAVVNTKGTAFYTNGTDGFLGVVAGDADVPSLICWSALQHAHHRAGLWFHRAGQPRGACVPLGYSHFMRWSRIPDGRDLPAELGGIQASYADPFRTQAAAGDGQFPTLAKMFAATPKDFDDAPAASYGPAVLFTEFLWEFSSESRKRYIRALRDYGASGRPVPAFPLKTLADELRPIFRTDKDLEDAFHVFVAQQSAAVNERKSGAK